MRGYIFVIDDIPHVLCLDPNPHKDIWNKLSSYFIAWNQPQSGHPYSKMISATVKQRASLQIQQFRHFLGSSSFNILKEVFQWAWWVCHFLHFANRTNIKELMVTWSFYSWPSPANFHKKISACENLLFTVLLWVSYDRFRVPTILGLEYFYIYILR